MNEQTVIDLEEFQDRETYFAAILTDSEYCNIDHIGYTLSLSCDIDRVGHVGFYVQDLKQIGIMLEDAGVSSVEKLIGKPCYMKKRDEKSGTYWDFKKMWKVM